MRWLLWLLLTFFLAGAVVGGSMFDLYPGKWTGEGLTVEVGTPETRRMKWTFQDPPQVLTGTYQVTAVKDSHHVTFLVSQITPGPSARFPQFTVKSGDELRTIMVFHDKKLQLTAFDRELKAVLTLNLEEE